MTELVKSWTKRQVQVQEWLAVPKYERVPHNQELLAKQLGIHWVTVSRWKRKPGWREAVNELVREGIGDRLNEVYGALLRGAEAGSIQHIRTVLELVGDLGAEVVDGGTQIAIVFNDKSIQANQRSMDPDMESEESTINLLPIQYSRLRQEMGQNGNRDGADSFSTNGDR